MVTQSITLACADGYPLAATLYPAEQARAVVVIAGALGVPRRFYAAYAGYLAQQGFVVLTFDYRGSGESSKGPVRGRDMRMQDWGQLDIDAALAWSRQHFAHLRLFLLGHSAGAQLAGLAAGSESLAGMILVAGSAPHLRHYPARDWPKLMLTWYVLGPVLSWQRDVFPAKQVGLGSTQVASGVVRQWARWARSRDYLFDSAHGMDTSGYARLTLPVLSYCFTDDSYAPPPATEALLAHYPCAQVDRRLVPKPPQGTLGHFGFFREQVADRLWQESADWLVART
jgi:predicted alpha/beta hydrolase